MKSLTTLTFLLATAVTFTATVVPAHAQTCSSVCSQLRRACNHSAQGAMKAAYVGCDETRDACTTDCEAEATTCLGDCETMLADCLAAGGSSESCDTARTQCLDECASCEADCGAGRGACRAEAKVTRDASRAACADSRLECHGSCVDPLDKTCVHGCTKAEHGCRADAKDLELACKKDCPKDSGRKSCMRTCRKNANLGARLCADTAVLCYADCAGITLTTTTTLP